MAAASPHCARCASVSARRCTRPCRPSPATCRSSAPTSPHNRCTQRPLAADGDQCNRMLTSRQARLLPHLLRLGDLGKFRTDHLEVRLGLRRPLRDLLRGQIRRLERPDRLGLCEHLRPGVVEEGGQVIELARLEDARRLGDLLDLFQEAVTILGEPGILQRVGGKDDDESARAASGLRRRIRPIRWIIWRRVRLAETTSPRFALGTSTPSSSTRGPRPHRACRRAAARGWRCGRCGRCRP